MNKFLSEFKKFAMRGNVVDLAVGVIIGGAFGKIVSSLVGDVLMPLLGLIVGGINFSKLTLTLKSAVVEGEKVIKPAVTINYGSFIQAVFDFTIIALAVFLLVRGINKLSRKKEQEPKKPSDEVMLLTEIRDLLKEKKESGTSE